jgi:hypothetical protein
VDALIRVEEGHMKQEIFEDEGEEEDEDECC